VPTRKTEHWVVPIMRDALEKGEFWLLGQLAINHSQHQKAVVEASRRVVQSRSEARRQYAEMHVTRTLQVSYEKKRAAIEAMPSKTAIERAAQDEKLRKLELSTAKARRKLVLAAGIE